MIPILEIGLNIVDKLTRFIPDPEQRQKAKLDLLRMQQEGELKQLEISMSAIIAEAQSQDKWTSRARPSFMYVMYLFLLASLPMGVIYVFFPDKAQALSLGVAGWLNALPEEMWWLFGTGYLGYTGARTFEKRKS